MAGVFQFMGKDWGKIHIDYMHLLPQEGQGPRPVILKYATFLNGDHVWSYHYTAKCPIRYSVASSCEKSQ